MDIATFVPKALTEAIGLGKGEYGCGMTTYSCSWFDGLRRYDAGHTNPVELKKDATRIYAFVDGVRVAGSTYGYYNLAIDKFENAQPLRLFASIPQNNRTIIYSDVRIWWAKAESDEGCIELIPALDSTGTPCMFDLVTRTPFYNSGTGDFSYPGSETATAQATTYSLRALRRPRMYAQMTEHGIRRLYHVPKGYSGTKDEYAAEHGFKVLVETEQPAEGYWAPQWRETEDTIELEWEETEPPANEEIGA